MTKKDYHWLANWLITSHQSIATINSLANSLADTNPAYEKHRFLHAVEQARETAQLNHISSTGRVL
jgi:hypothetical protein